MTIEILSKTFTLDGKPIGIELTADQQGLTACRLLPETVTFVSHTQNQHLVNSVATLQKYLDGGPCDLDAYLSPDGTPFQQAVWQTTRGIPYGEVRSYSWVANQIGNPKAVRAVAQALAANPLLLFVPCHRVVRSNGDLGGFGCGVNIKMQLLALEGILEESALKLAGAGL